MKHTVTLMCMALFAGFPASAQSIGEKTGVNATLKIAPSTSDFVRGASDSDLFHIQAGRLALVRGNENTKAVARRLIADHDAALRELTALLNSSAATDSNLATGLGQDHQAQFDKLQTQTGDDFNANFAMTVAVADQETISLFERYSNGGDRDDLKIWAAKKLPVFRQHLALLKELIP